MNLKKKILICICVLFLMITTLGCEKGNDKADIYNDKDKIAQENNNFTFVKRICNEESNDKFDMDYDGFYGTNNIWNIQSKENGEITFDYDSVVNKGNFKAVLVHPNKEIETILEGTEKDSKTIKLTEGKYIFKIVGKKAKGKLKISNSTNENVNVRQGRIY
ncbi:hypothetical protein NNC19_08260 [Clostridium sp. SHJSY1]|uniref:hypothetical protein n=1 Tax=Clostridium sp. SHJSY1 TaxID=2942483 RepID=UPI002874070A|nr:hypothetical protein [Clostridium sp. SHJSY1]MDS0525668.1 hypothetical protein [Clostridium sp. SHJSY1]